MCEKIKKNERLLKIELPYACYGIIVVEGTIIDSAPIARWAIGKDLEYFIRWVEKKGGTIYDYTIHGTY